MTKTSKPRITIVTPCYNQARYLPEAVGSVIAQTYTDWELLIVDDGSPDNTAAIAEQLIAGHPEHTIRLVRQANQGLAASRNNAITLAHGEYILPLDADDAIEPHMLARTVAMLDKHPEVGFVYSDTILFGAESGIAVNQPYSLQALRFNCLLHSLSLFRRAAWESAGGYRTNMNRGYEDWDFWLSLAENGWEGRHIAEPLIRYRRSPTSKLSKDRRYDMEIRAQIILNHPRLYPPEFLAWATRVYSPGWSDQGTLRTPYHWWRAFLAYNRLIARYCPNMLSRTLLRPIFWRLPIRFQSDIRRIARSVFR